MNNCGIYIIESTLPGSWYGKKYIGCSVDYKKRIYEHFQSLIKGKHHSHKLQRFYNKYGKEFLRYRLLMLCSKKEFNFYERFFIKCFDARKNGFNERDGGYDRNELRRSNQYVCFELKGPDGKIYKGKNLSSFVRERELKYTSLRRVIAGKQNNYKGWLLPNEVYRLDNYIKFKLLSPDGKIHEGVNLEAFARKHGLKGCSLQNVLSGRRCSNHGWKNADKEKRRPDGRIYRFSIRSPDGKIFTTSNVSLFAKKHNLEMSSIWKVIAGKINNYKGWTLPDVEYKSGYIKFELIDPNGRVYKGENLHRFSIEHNLSSYGIYSIVTKRRKSYKGWRLYDKNKACTAFVPRKRINLTIKNRDGEVVKVDNIIEFSKKINVPFQGFYGLAKGEQQSHYGWTLYKE